MLFVVAVCCLLCGLDWRAFSLLCVLFVDGVAVGVCCCCWLWLGGWWLLYVVDCNGLVFVVNCLVLFVVGCYVLSVGVDCLLCIVGAV